MTAITVGDELKVDVEATQGRSYNLLSRIVHDFRAENCQLSRILIVQVTTD